jgi:hypothetical protein
MLALLIRDQWSFLTPLERERLLIWALMCPWVPIWFVSSNWFVHLFAGTMGEITRKKKEERNHG